MLSYIKRLFFPDQANQNLTTEQEQSTACSENITNSEIQDSQSQLSSTIILVEESYIDFDDKPYVPKSHLLRNEPVPSVLLSDSSDSSEDEKANIEMVHGYIQFPPDKHSDGKSNFNKENTSNNNVSQFDITQNQSLYMTEMESENPIPVPKFKAYLQFSGKSNKNNNFSRKESNMNSLDQSEISSHSINLDNKTDINPKKVNGLSSMSKIFLSPINFDKLPKEKNVCPGSRSKSVQFGPQKPSNEDDTDSSSIPRKPILRKQSNSDSKNNAVHNSLPVIVDNTLSNNQNTKQKTTETSPVFDYSFIEYNNSGIDSMSNKKDISTISNSKNKRIQNTSNKSNESLIAQKKLNVNNSSSKNSFRRSMLQPKNDNIFSSYENVDAINKTKSKNVKLQGSPNLSVQQNNYNNYYKSDLFCENDDIIMNSNKFKNWNNIESDDEIVEVVQFPNLKLNNSK